ncbi:MAG: hypothetical protein ABI455_02020 [Candidatus Dormiibacterota bacterium]
MPADEVPNRNIGPPVRMRTHATVDFGTDGEGVVSGFAPAPGLNWAAGDAETDATA